MQSRSLFWGNSKRLSREAAKRIQDDDAKEDLIQRGRDDVTLSVKYCAIVSKVAFCELVGRHTPFKDEHQKHKRAPEIEP